MTKTMTLIQKIIDGKANLKNENLIFTACELQDTVLCEEYEKLKSIDSDFYDYLDDKVFEVCEACDDCTPEEVAAFIEGVRDMRDHAISILRDKGIDPSVF